GWTRGYAYDQGDGAPQNNRLYATTLSGDDPAGDATTWQCKYDHDLAGNMTGMPHLTADWDHRNQMIHGDLSGGGRGYVTYDATGQRVRKLWVDQDGEHFHERIYIGGYEIYRDGDDISTATATVERETLHVMDDKQRVALVETKITDGGADVTTPTVLPR